jgi:hypothetical protein
MALPSSQSSMPGRMARSPQMAGSPRAKVAEASARATMATSCRPLVTIWSPLRPSTRSTIVCPPSDSGSSSAAVSRPLVSGRGGSGSVPAAKAGAPSLVVPDISRSDSDREAS